MPRNKYMFKFSFKFLGLLLLVLFALFITSCEKACCDESNPECENYDPCFGVNPANADFTINEVVLDFLSESDTVYAFNNVRFIPKNPADKVTWVLGAERVVQNELERRNFPSGLIEVTMIAEIDRADCLLEEESIDSVTKYFFVIPNVGQDSFRNRQSPWWGTWEGTTSSRSDEPFTVSFGFIDNFKRASLPITGLPYGILKQKAFYSASDSRISGVRSAYGYKSYVIQDMGIHQDWGGFALNAVCKREGNNVEISYRYNNRPYQNWLNEEPLQVEPIDWVEETFIGKKINNKVETE